jgi:hypothetical protein
MTFIETRPNSASALSEQALRRLIDLSVAKALFNPEFASELLANPTVVVDDKGCAPQHYKRLRSIRACNVTDFAQQAEHMFWIVGPRPPSKEDHGRLATAAAS